MIERHQDYVVVIPSIPSGQAVIDYPIQMETDAPFMARGRGIRISPPAATRSQADVNLTRFQFRNQAGSYTSGGPIQAPQDFQYAFGQNAQYRRIWPQQPYSPGSEILVSVYNDSPDTLTNVQVMFRGVKLFRDGAIPAPSYPPTARALDFTYQSGKGTSTDPAIILQNVDTTNIVQWPFNVKSDADFVLRGMQAGLWSPSGANGLYSPFGYTELYIQLFDQNLKAYSNAPLHIDWFMGNGGAVGTNQASFPNLGNSAPGLVVPEIYIPKNGALYFNMQRNDAAYVGVTDSLPVRIAMAWIGSKVYAQ